MSVSKPEWPGTLRLWIALIWLAVGVLNGAQIVIGMHAAGMRHHWAALFFVNTISWLVWACATPLVFSLGDRFPISRALGWKGCLVHLAALLSIVFVDALWISAWYHWLNPLAESPKPPPLSYLLVNALFERCHVGMITYVAILAAGHTIASLKRLAMREAELSKAQLDSLRRQLEPHFLFNTLNGVAGLVREGKNAAAVEMIAGLSDLLRHVLEGGDRELVPLAEELSFLERYIELQSMRFGDRLKVVVGVPPDLYGARVPSLILQPLVENAIQHGIGRRVEGGVIHVCAAGSDGMLTLSVHNDGPALPPGGIEPGCGVGIANTRRRLAALYGPECALVVRNHALAGVETIVRVPYGAAL
jgi:hypothetical protein